MRLFIHAPTKRGMVNIIADGGLPLASSWMLRLLKPKSTATSIDPTHPTLSHLAARKAAKPPKTGIRHTKRLKAMGVGRLAMNGAAIRASMCCGKLLPRA